MRSVVSPAMIRTKWLPTPPSPVLQVALRIVGCSSLLAIPGVLRTKLATSQSCGLE